MKKQSDDNNTLIAKCCDGAFRKIKLVDATESYNAMANYGVKGLVYGTYTNDNDQPRFTKVG